MIRDALLDLAKWKASKIRKPLIILGARQVGKTYLAKEFADRAFQTAHNFNFELEPDLKALFDRDLTPQRILQELSFRRGRAIDLNNDMVFFDEIQAAPKALTSLKHFHEQLPELAVCAAGSLLGLHLADSSFPVGNVDFLKLHPMSFQEFLHARAPQREYTVFLEAKHGGEPLVSAHQKFWDYWREYLVTGGLPEVVARYLETGPSTLRAFSEARETQQKIIKAYLADVAKHSGKINALHIDRVWHSIPIQMAAAQDLSVSCYKFKNVVPGIHNYGRLIGPIDWLMKAGLILQIPICDHAETPLRAFTKQNQFKLMMFDVGILGAMLDIPVAALLNFDFGTYKGYFAENFVAQELVCAQPEKSLYGWAEGKSKIEFLVQGDSGPIPIEVKSATRIRAQSLKSFIDKYKPHTSIVLSGNPASESTHANGKTRKVNLPLYLACSAREKATDQK
jgi:uncharacterized protein